MGFRDELHHSCHSSCANDSDQHDAKHIADIHLHVRLHGSAGSQEH